MSIDFSALATSVIDVRIDLPYNGDDGKPAFRVFPIKTLTYHEWNSVALDYPPPDLNNPKYATRLDDNGRPAPDASNADYRRDVADWNEEIQYRRMIRALELGGVSVPGATIEAKVQTFKTTVDAGIGNALLGFLLASVRGGKGRALSTVEAAQFRQNGAGGVDAGLSENPAAVGHDAT